MKKSELTELFFKYIKDKHLERKGVTAEDLHQALYLAGFATIGCHDYFEWTDKAVSGEFKREFWKVIDTCKPNSYLLRTFLGFLVLGLGALYSPSALQSVGSLGLPKYFEVQQPHCRTVSTKHSFLDHRLDYYQPYHGGYRENT